MTERVDFAELFAGCQEAFWLEGNPVYEDPAEHAALAHFRKTGKVIAPTGRPWPGIIAHATAAGTTIGRLRLVSEPLTEYETWELGVFASGWAPGEEVRVLPRFRRPYQRDVWVFDRTRAMWQTYDDAGRRTGTEFGPADAACAFWIRRFEETSITPADYLTFTARAEPAAAVAPTSSTRRSSASRRPPAVDMRPAFRSG